MVYSVGYGIHSEFVVFRVLVTLHMDAVEWNLDFETVRLSGGFFTTAGSETRMKSDDIFLLFFFRGGG